MKNCLGIEIGHYRIKIAYAEKGELKEFISERVQGMDLTDMHVCADLIKDLLKEYAIRCRNVVFVIRQEDVYVRRFEMPLMTEEQLRLNLPYEFHDYIGDEMDKYVFDYAMIQTKERTMDLLGAACTKTLSQQFEKLAKMARLKLVGLVPAVLGLERILEYAQERKDYAVLDLGTQALRIHFFREGVYDITRTMEPGCEEIEQIRLGDKNKMQELGIEVEEENREKTDKEKIAAVLEEQYRTRAVQVMRVLNFYSFNNVNNTIDSLYYCGGGARYGELIDALKETLDLADYVLDSGNRVDSLLVEASFYTLNAGYNTDRFRALEETLNNPLAYCLNFEYNVNALTVAMDTLKGTPDTIESGDWTAADYLADDGTTLPLHRKLYDYPAIITPKCRSWTLNEAQLTRLAELAARCQNEGIALTIVLPPMAENVRTEVCDPFGITEAMQDEVLPELHAIAAETGCTLLDYEWNGSCITDDDTQFFDGFHLDEKYGLPDWTEELFTDIG